MNDQKPMNTIAKAAIIILFGTIFIKLLTYVFRIIIARTGVENYGLISLGLAVYGVISVICIFGMDTGLYGLLSRTIQKEEEKAKEFIVSAVKISLALSLILSFLLFILSDWLALTYFHNENLKIIIQIIAISIPFGVFRSIIQTTLRSFQLVKLDTTIRIFKFSPCSFLFRKKNFKCMAKKKYIYDQQGFTELFLAIIIKQYFDTDL